MSYPQAFTQGPFAVLRTNHFHGRASVKNATQYDSGEGGSLVSALTFKEITPAVHCVYVT